MIERGCVVFSALGGVGHYSPLVSLAVALLNDNISIKFLIRESEVNLLLSLFGSRGIHTVPDDVLLVVEKDIYDFTFCENLSAEKGYAVIFEAGEKRQPLLESTLEKHFRKDTNKMIGVCDFFDLAAARLFTARKAPYFVTLPGPPLLLAILGAMQPTNIDEVMGYIFIHYFRYSKVYQFCQTVTEVYRNAQCCFASSFDENLISQPSSCLDIFKTQYSDKIQQIRTFGPPLEQVKNSSKYSPELVKFLNQAEIRQVPIIMVATSTLVRSSLTPYGLRAIYQALKDGKDKWAVVWRINDRNLYEKAGIPIAQIDDWFLPQDWLPQFALLSEPNLKCLISHCGWNAVNEALQTATPVLATPVCADQPINARLIEKWGMGLILDSEDTSEVKMTTRPADPLVRPHERFTSADVGIALDRILSPDSNFLSTARHIQQQVFPPSHDSAPKYGPAFAISEIKRLLEV